MPVHRTSKPTCFQWGSHGATYCGRGAATKAAAQGRAAYAHGYQGKGHTRRTEIEHPDLIRLWDTRDLREGDDIPGIGVVHDRAIITYHVTDDPSRPSSALRKRANLLQAYGPKGAHAELGPGLYVSGVPSYWLARTRGKWAFLQSLSPNELQCVTEALAEQVRQQRDRGYISTAEERRGLKLIADVAGGPRPLDGGARWEPSPDLLCSLANQPHNIAWWKSEWLAQCGVKAAPAPRALELRVVGVFAELGRTRPDPALLRTLRKLGVAGAFTRSGFGTAPEMVVWDPAAVVGSRIVEV